MQHSESITNIAKALLTVQSQVGKVKKDSKAFKYVYTSLDHVIDVVRPILVESGIVVTQCMGTAGGNTISTTIIHAETGEWIRSTYSLSAAGMQGVNDAQQMGAAITYARRYCLLAILNIAPGDDDDAQCLTEPAKPEKSPDEIACGELWRELNAVDSESASTVAQLLKAGKIDHKQGIVMFQDALDAAAQREGE